MTGDDHRRADRRVALLCSALYICTSLLTDGSAAGMALVGAILWHVVAIGVSRKGWRL